MTSIDADQYPHCANAQAFVDGVLSGKVLACEMIRLACERHQRDLARVGEADWPYYFDYDQAERVARFVTRFPHVKGRWAARRELFRPEPWQDFWYTSLFGWLKISSGKRRFQRARMYTPRKNGKSMSVAPLGLYMLAADGEEGAEVFSGATNEKQAWEVFGPAKQMATMRPDFQERFGVQVNAKSLVVVGSMGKFEPVIGQPGDGASPHCSITDEYHEHITDEQLATMETGMGAREQPLSVIVSTAGDNLAGPCRDDWLECERMLRGTLADDALFALIFTVDKDVDWSSDAALQMANPNYGVSVSADWLREKQREAINNPRKQGHFKTKHLNLWVQARDAYFNMLRWSECARPGKKLEEFRGQRCWMGMDLASKIDLSALEFVFPQTDGSFFRFGKYYIPRETVDAPENGHYRAWEQEGILTVTEGNQTDYFQIFDDIKDAARIFDLAELAFDPHNATMLVTACQDEGLPMIEFGPTVLNFSEPMKQVEALIRDRKLYHNGDKLMEWAMSNVVAKMDRKDNVFPNKERNENKIDPVVALIMAMGRFMAGGETVDDFSGFIKAPVVG